MRRVWAISSARASSSMGKRPLPSGYARITEMLSRIHAQNRGAIHSGTSSCRASYFATSSAPSTPSGRHVSSLTAESLPHRTDLAARSWGLRRLLLCPNGIQTVPERVEGQSDDVEVDLALDDVVVEVAASAVVAGHGLGFFDWEPEWIPGVGWEPRGGPGRAERPVGRRAPPPRNRCAIPLPTRPDHQHHQPEPGGNHHHRRDQRLTINDESPSCTTPVELTLTDTVWQPRECRRSRAVMLRLSYAAVGLWRPRRASCRHTQTLRRSPTRS